MILDSEQLLSNPDFDLGTTGWSSNRGTLSVVENNLIVVSNTVGTNLTASYTLPLSVDDKFYYFYRARITTDTHTKLGVYVFSAGDVEINAVVPTKDVWYDFKGITTFVGSFY